jgi:hypothetical protein
MRVGGTIRGKGSGEGRIAIQRIWMVGGGIEKG